MRRGGPSSDPRPDGCAVNGYRPSRSGVIEMWVRRAIPLYPIGSDAGLIYGRAF